MTWSATRRDRSWPGMWPSRARGRTAAAGSELVIHTAATVSLRLERRDDIWRSNVLGTANAIDAAQRAGAQRFVHFSSVTVFGLEFPDGVDERYPVHNTFIPYPDSKIAAEQVVLQAHLDDRVQCTVVRPGDVYGPRSRVWATVPAELIRQRRFVLPGFGPRHSFTRLHRQPRRRGRARGSLPGRGRPGVHAV